MIPQIFPESHHVPSTMQHCQEHREEGHSQACRYQVALDRLGTQDLGKPWLCLFWVVTFPWALKYTLLYSPRRLNQSLLVINYHSSHCSKNEMLLLSFCLLKNSLQASIHNHLSLLLSQRPLSSTAGMATSSTACYFHTPQQLFNAIQLNKTKSCEPLPN